MRQAFYIHVSKVSIEPLNIPNVDYRSPFIPVALMSLR